MLDVRIKVRLLLLEARCPCCSSSNLRPGLIRPWVEGTLFRSWLLLSLRRPFLCRDCDERFYDFRFKARLLAHHKNEFSSMLEDYTLQAVDDTETIPAEDKKDRTA